MTNNKPQLRIHIPGKFPWIFLFILVMGCADDAPPEENCDPAVSECGADILSDNQSGGGLPGIPPCGSLSLCVEACEGNVSCESACGEGLEPYILTYHGQLLSCLMAHGCNSLGEAGLLAGYDACVFEHCAGPYQNCFGPLKQGGDSCALTLDCMNACDTGDGTCLHECGTQGTLDAQTHYFKILACTEENCQGRAGAAWEVCANTLCKAEVDNCIAHEVD